MTSALFTDLYEFKMAEAYIAEGMNDLAVFELCYRHLPPNRECMVAGGISDALEFLAGFRFTPEELDWLRCQVGFEGGFLDFLSRVRFTGDVYAVRTGCAVYPYEPLLQVIAPIAEAQLVETALLNLIHYQTLVLTKAVRVVRSAAGRAVIDFGARRAPGTDAALHVARALWVAGGAGTSNVEAGQRFGIPVFGTIAHSYIQAHNSEREAFEALAAHVPDATVLVDTYDTPGGVALVIALKQKLGDAFRVKAVRLDSGDLAMLASETRRMLDEAGMRDIRIFASSGLDEYEIEKLLKAGAPIDIFGVGTKLAVCGDGPELDMAYKLVEYGGRGCFKLSRGKTVYPGRKQVFRTAEADIIGRFDEDLPGERLLKPAIVQGKMQPQPSAEEVRKFVGGQMVGRRPVRISAALERDLETARRTLSPA